tara:strand:+ start:81 stop:191 length:111 start_codon:yes stop_codon:yes gene_type:complete
MPSELDNQQYKLLQLAAEDCSLKLNIEKSINIKLNW